MTRRAGPVTEISGFASKNSVTGMKLFPYERSSPARGADFFRQRELRFRNIATKKASFYSCFYIHFGSTQISFISKDTRVHKALTVANDISLCFIILINSCSVDILCSL